MAVVDGREALQPAIKPFRNAEVILPLLWQLDIIHGAGKIRFPFATSLSVPLTQLHESVNQLVFEREVS